MGKVGRPVAPPNTTLQVRLSDPLVEVIDRRAAAEGLTRSDILREAIAAHLGMDRVAS